MSKDPLGKALYNYFESGEEQILNVYSKELHAEEYKASYFFRTFSEMPKQEQKALDMCFGKVLDVGAGAGCHSLWLKENGFDVDAIDTSSGAVETMVARGISNATCQFVEKHEGKYDTVLMLMNGIGLAGKLKNLSVFLNQLKGLLKPNGQILTDSSDIFHLFESIDSDQMLEFEKDYLGEVEFQFSYKKERGPWFKWLYLDERTFREYAEKSGFHFEVIWSKKNAGYLTRLTLID